MTATLELVRRMRREAFSRNRNFDAFARADGHAADARRLWRYLRGLEQTLTQVGPQGIRVDVRPDGTRRITIAVPEVRMLRIAHLTAEEYGLLKEHPDARALLDRAEQ